MNDTQIEMLLRKAPQIAAPAGLLEQLIGDINLPRAATRGQNHPDAKSFFRRWFPAISFAAFLLTCVIVVGVQTNLVSQLRQQNKALRASSQNLEQLRNENAEYQRLLAANQELERLRKDALELPRLRAEVEQLRAQLQGLETMRTENQALLATATAAQKQSEEEDPFAQAKKKAESIACINNLKQIGLAARIWAMNNKTDNKELYPSDFVSMSNELTTTKILICPGDKGKTAAENWSAFDAASASYEILAPGISDRVSDAANVVYARCPIHNSVVCVDGHAEMLGPNRKVVNKNGQPMIERDLKPQK
jgi:hypothetical protein